MKWELIPVADSGYTVQVNGTYDCKYDNTQGGKVANVTFINKGSNSNVRLQGPGIDILLAVNETIAFTAPVGGYLITEYKYSFRNAGGAGASVNQLNILIQKYVDA